MKYFKFNLKCSYTALEFHLVPSVLRSAVSSTTHTECRLKHSWQRKFPDNRVYAQKHVADTPKHQINTVDSISYLRTASSRTLSIRRPPSALPHYLILRSSCTASELVQQQQRPTPSYFLPFPIPAWHCSWLHHCHLLPLSSSEGQPQTSEAAGIAQANEALLDPSWHHPWLPSICTVQPGSRSPAPRCLIWLCTGGGEAPQSLPAKCPQHWAAILLFQDLQLS